MKRIIKIDEALYNTIMCTPYSPVLGWREIAESVPYNPQGDCISRSDLKKAIYNDLGLGDEDNGSDAEYMAGLQDCYNLIDNAQAVEPERPQGGLTEVEKKICKMYLKDLDKTHTCNEYKLLKSLIDNAQTAPERPQGEWLFKHNSSDIWCSVCDENFDEIPQAFNFCPNCGAEMRTKENENG